MYKWTRYKYISRFIPVKAEGIAAYPISPEARAKALAEVNKELDKISQEEESNHRTLSFEQVR